MTTKALQFTQKIHKSRKEHIAQEHYNKTKIQQVKSNKSLFQQSEMETQTLCELSGLVRGDNGGEEAVEMVAPGGGAGAPYT